MTECCILGGGIVGLSIARELAGRGHAVRVLCRETGRDTASWAAAGILPPAPDGPAAPPAEALTALSHALHRRWAAELLDETGIDTGLRACGGLHVCRDRERLEADAAGWRARGAACDWLEAADVAAVEPALAGAVDRGAVAAGFALPEEMQIRPPRHLEALRRSCEGRGVGLVRGATVRRIAVRRGRIDHVVADVAGVREAVRADVFVVAAGAWSAALVSPLGVALDTRPIRGQIVQLRVPSLGLRRIVTRGLDYLVPRGDGTLLAGSTLEDAGFDAATDAAAIAGLLADVRELVGDVDPAAVERSWAGLRPGTPDGLPSIGPVPGCGNAFVAAGHFRAGIHQAPGTAVLVADLVEARRPALDPAAFAIDRPPSSPTRDSVPVLLARARAEA